MNSEVIAKVLISIPFGIVISLFITPIFIFMRKIFYGPLTNKKLLEKAIKDGHVVQAKLIKRYDVKQDSEKMRMGNGMGMVPTGEQEGVYEYEYNGKTYRYHAISAHIGQELSKNATLYFIKNPRKAATKKELFLTAKSPWIVSYLILSVCISIIAFFILLYVK